MFNSDKNSSSKEEVKRWYNFCFFQMHLRKSLDIIFQRESNTDTLAIANEFPTRYIFCCSTSRAHRLGGDLLWFITTTDSVSRNLICHSPFQQAPEPRRLSGTLVFTKHPSLVVSVEETGNVKSIHKQLSTQIVHLKKEEFLFSKKKQFHSALNEEQGQVTPSSDQSPSTFPGARTKV